MTEKQLSLIRENMKDPGDYICITDGNNKIGHTMNFSMLPVFTCPARCMTSCAAGAVQELKNRTADKKRKKSKCACYALKDLRYPTVIHARCANTWLARHDLPRLKKAITARIAKQRKRRENKRCKQHGEPIFFRLHESGDFCSLAYLLMWCEIAVENADVHFYTYTKAYEIVRAGLEFIPENLCIMISAWTGLELPADLIGMTLADGRPAFAVAYCDDGIEDRIPAGAFHCPATGSASDEMTCEKCGYQCARHCVVFFTAH